MPELAADSPDDAHHIRLLRRRVEHDADRRHSLDFLVGWLGKFFAKDVWVNLFLCNDRHSADPKLLRPRAPKWTFIPIKWV